MQTVLTRFLPESSGQFSFGTRGTILFDHFLCRAPTTKLSTRPCVVKLSVPPGFHKGFWGDCCRQKCLDLQCLFFFFKICDATCDFCAYLFIFFTSSGKIASTGFRFYTAMSEDTYVTLCTFYDSCTHEHESKRALAECVLW